MLRSMHGYEKESPRSEIEGRAEDSSAETLPAAAEFRTRTLLGRARLASPITAALYGGEFKPGLFVSAGCNGGGTVKGTLLGKLLAEAAHGLKVPDVPELFGRASWMPPEPIRRLGFKLSSTIESHHGRHEL